jgi:hypothetical protein
MFDVLLKSILPPGVTPELLYAQLGQALQRVHQVADTVQAIQARQAEQDAILYQIIEKCQPTKGNDHDDPVAAPDGATEVSGREPGSGYPCHNCGSRNRNNCTCPGDHGGSGNAARDDTPGGTGQIDR